MDYEKPVLTDENSAKSLGNTDAFCATHSQNTSDILRPASSQNAGIRGESCDAACESDGRTVYTYFLYCPRTKRVKIGKAIDVAKRIRSLACGSSYPTKLVGVIPQNRECELHRRFRSNRRHGEWFYVDKRLASFIASLPIDDIVDAIIPECHLPPMTRERFYAVSATAGLRMSIEEDATTGRSSMKSSARDMGGPYRLASESEAPHAR